MDNLEYLKEVEKSIQKKYKKKLWRPFCKAINQYELVKPGDCCMYFWWKRFYVDG